MIKVCWAVEGSDSWLGGVNYFNNLAQALYSLPERSVEPVLSSPAGRERLPFPLNQLSAMTNYKKFSIPWFWHKSISMLLRKDMREVFFRSNGIRLCSHAFTADFTNKIPALCWIPDFQHKYFPNLYSEEALSTLDYLYSQMACKSQGLILSSESAKKHFQKFYPGSSVPLYILPFVASIPEEDSCYADRKTILEKYNINHSYFFIPNQLWIHKNHKIVIEALKAARDHNVFIKIICSGNTKDWRNSTYFEELQKMVEEYDLGNNISFLGIIPREDVFSLLRYSIAAINPSFFEGWSTSVEEAKSMGKDIILSDIDVHREQNPRRCSYFQPDNAMQLMEIMIQRMNEYDMDYDNHCIEVAMTALKERQKDYARRYEEIIHKAVQA